jgi:hypothetical protein
MSAQESSSNPSVISAATCLRYRRGVERGLEFEKKGWLLVSESAKVGGVGKDLQRANEPISHPTLPRDIFVNSLYIG